MACATRGKKSSNRATFPPKAATAPCARSTRGSPRWKRRAERTTAEALRGDRSAWYRGLMPTGSRLRASTFMRLALACIGLALMATAHPAPDLAPDRASDRAPDRPAALIGQYEG